MRYINIHLLLLLLHQPLLYSLFLITRIISISFKLWRQHPPPHWNSQFYYYCVLRQNSPEKRSRNTSIWGGVKGVLHKKYIFKDLLLFHGTIGGSLNISLSNNPVLLRGRHFVRVEPLEVICKQPDANRSKECHHRRHSFTENRDLMVVITANRLVFWNCNTAS